MSANPDTVEAYKSVIDFNKTIISISSAILSALIAYLVYQGVDYNIPNLAALFVIVLSVVLSITGFGQAIQSVKDGVSRRLTILMTNLGAYLLVVGILLVFCIKQDNPKTLDSILQNIQSSTAKMSYDLRSKNCRQIVVKGDIFYLQYVSNKKVIDVIFSQPKNQILSVKGI